MDFIKLHYTYKCYCDPHENMNYMYNNITDITEEQNRRNRK